MAPARPHVVIIGGGFGGLEAAKALATSPVRITLIDRSNHHLFQPLLYQVAMAGLSPAEIAVPIRSILSEQENVEVLLGEVASVDTERRTVALRGDRPSSITYDFLIVAAGARTSYFGHPEWATFALGLKDLDDAIEIRRRVLVAFEAAEREADPAVQRELLTFVVIGGGPTGVELAGAISELSTYVLARDFRHVDPSVTRVVLVEAGPRILAALPEELSASALRQLAELGVEVRTGAMVTAIDAGGAELGAERIPASTVIWAAGVRAAAIGETLGAPLDRAGRVLVAGDCSLPGRPEVLVIGDLAHQEQDGQLLPGVSPVAMQQGRHAARMITRTLAGLPRQPFRYRDKGTMATIGRKRAVAMVGALRFSGFFAWLTWLFVHIWYLIGFRNRLMVLLDWAWSYFTYKRGARLITGRLLAPPAPPRALEADTPGARLPASAARAVTPAARTPR